MNEDEIYPLNTFEYIKSIKEKLDKIENTLKNEDFDSDCDCKIRIETLLNVIGVILYEFDVVLTGCYGDDEK